ncbi:tyrosine-type recombinase/integrase [Mycobacterium sp. pUA109]|uniref:tyrosine-type recombinase/integrase n=1 Tax=Mycobacterium sp. pUA109 TaxID=3238982 RepID=UPI00351B0BFC
MTRNRRAGVEDLWTRTVTTNGATQKVDSARAGRGKRWRARYVDDTGQEHTKAFARKTDAQRWIDEVTAAVVTGQYVDPGAGQITFRDYAERWRKMQVHRRNSVAHVETMLRRHAYPTLGDRRLSEILPSDVQAWVKGLKLAPATVGVVHGLVSTVMKAAIRDRRIIGNPCDGTKLPKAERKKVIPLPTEQVAAIHDAMPPELRALITLAAGTGMRQGECFGLTVDRVRFLERTVNVDRQLVTVSGHGSKLAPPKTAASNRIIPLPQVVVDALAAHLAEFPAVAFTEGAEPVELVFTLAGKPITRAVFGHRWRAATAKLKLPPRSGLHLLRHYYASLLIRHGESVKTVQSRLGHASAVETLDTYSHLWPDSDDRTRDAIDSVLGSAAYPLRTGGAATT